MNKIDDPKQKLLNENADLKSKLEEAEETLRAIRLGEIDALVVKGENGHQVYTLKGAEHTYRILIESMNEGAVTLDSKRTILYSNKSFAGMLGYPLEKVVGLQFRDFINKDDVKNFENVIKNPTKKNTSPEINLIKKNKDLLPVLLSIANTQFEDGQIGINMIITNLTEQKRNEELAASEKYTESRLAREQEVRTQIEHLAEELRKERNNLQLEILERKKLEKQKDEFIGIASHELKTPVTSIKAYTQVLQHRFRKENNVKATELLSKMNSQLNKLTNLISDLLDITKIEGGKLRFHETFFDLNELIQEIIEEMQRTTKVHEIVKNVVGTKSIWGDRERIGQVITNFLSNAIKYSPSAGKIIVSTSNDKNKITVCVQDFGLGIPEKDRGKIFDRFYRVGGAKSETYPGLGLGLYISSEIIRRHRGKIWVTSKNGKGSTFCFTIPISGDQ